MKQLNDKMVCELVRDLLPLYADGACTESSRILVQEHIQECESCRSMLEAMRAPLPVDAAEIQTIPAQKTQPVKKAVKKIKRRSLIAGVLAVIVLLPLIFLGVNQCRGEGISFSAVGHIAKTEQILKTWKNEGLAGVSQKLNSPESEYEVLTTPHIFYEDVENRYAEYTVDGETYMIQKDSIGISDDGSTQPTIELEKIKSVTELWHELLKLDWHNKMIPEAIYQKLEALYGEEYCAQLLHHPSRIETEYGVFYSTEAVAADLEQTEISADMQRVISDSAQLNPVFRFGYYTTVMSKPVYDAYVEQCHLVDQWNQEYADYYKELGLDGFKKLWQERAAQMVENESLQDCRPVEYEYRAVHRDVSSLNEGGEWTVEWQVTFADGAEGELWLSESGNGQYRISAAIGDGADLSERTKNSYALMNAQYYAEGTWWLYH